MKRKLHEFIGALRDAGLRISSAEAVDAAAAAARLGVEPLPFREGLAATLVKDEADRGTYDEVFARFFAAPRAPRPHQEKKSGAAGAGQRGSAQTDGDGTARRASDDTDEPRPGKRDASRTDARPAAARQQQRDSGAARRLSERARLAATPLDRMTPDQAEACPALAADLSRRFRGHFRRRNRRGRRGRLDVRRTLRLAAATGSVPLELALRRRRPGRTDLVVLCDFSYSVVIFSEFLLALLLPLEGYFRSVRRFAFVDAPVAVTLEDGRCVPHAPLDLHARSDFGRVLDVFAREYFRLIRRGTVLLVLGDARNNRRPARADRLAALHRAGARIVWLNPEDPARWDTGDSVMSAYARECDVLLSACTPAALERALEQTLAWSSLPSLTTLLPSRSS